MGQCAVLGIIPMGFGMIHVYHCTRQMLYI